MELSYIFTISLLTLLSLEYAEGKDCGIQHPQKKYKIIYSDERRVFPGDYPWYVNVQVKNDQIGYLGCSGVIIDEKWIIMAAHCYSHNPHFTLLHAKADERLIVEFSDEQNVKVKQIIIHPSYKWFRERHDIALLELQSPVKLNKLVDIVCLPNENEQFEKSDCTAIGKGLTDKDLLKKAIIPTIDYKLCQEILKVKTYPEYLCAGFDNIPNSSTVCSANIAGPLFCSRANSNGINQWHFAGIANMAFKDCGKSVRPAIFTRISSYLPWIKETMQSNSKKT